MLGTEPAGVGLGRAAGSPAVGVAVGVGAGVGVEADPPEGVLGLWLVYKIWVSPACVVTVREGPGWAGSSFRRMVVS